jgi:hypothetical protein
MVDAGLAVDEHGDADTVQRHGPRPTCLVVFSDSPPGMTMTERTVLVAERSRAGEAPSAGSNHCRVYRHLCRCFPTMILVDYSRPLEAVIPGTPGKVLGVLARTHAELPTAPQWHGPSRHRLSISAGALELSHRYTDVPEYGTDLLYVTCAPRHRQFQVGRFKATHP